MTMDDNQFWAAFWKSVAAVICAITLTIGGCVSHNSYLIGEAIKKGADPVAVRCGLDANGTTSSPVCVLLASKQGAK
jgi:hypothetical protein